jgi:CxxC motif-containing protein (DUF1111 family)
MLVVSLLVAAGCESTLPPGVDDDGREDDGPVAAGVSAKLGDPVPTATAEQLETFERGKAVAVRRFDLADGLGPAFNVVSCAACHERPTVGGGAGLYRNFFLSGRRTSAGTFVPGESAGMAGGVIRTLFYGEGETFRPVIPDVTNVFAQRNPIPMFGVGLIAELDEEEILQRADPDDADGDGISGRPNFDRGFVGRFGRKSQTVSIEGFIRGPLFNHLGVTTVPLSDGQRAQLPVDSSSTAKRTARILQAAAADAPNFDDDGVADPEMSQQDLFELVSFSMLLAAPKLEEPTVQSNRGRLLFKAAGCADCHTPRLEGPRGPLPVYSDLLLHDMGEELADRIEQGIATGSEFRTQPLWGVSAVGPYLHDGRADTLKDAILMHGGEAQAARDDFAAYDEVYQDDVIEFLLSLGGRDQQSEGLVEPGAPVAPVGEFGGPFRELTSAEAERFLRGRAVYDRDHGHERGVGGMWSTLDTVPRFNGDSCRACHFDPVIGGAGPRDVNVMRHCTITPKGDFAAPPDTPNTILHRHVRVDNLPAEPAEAVNFFEHRQTPHTLGLGLIEAIEESTILALADPDDSDGDGIRGRAHILADGRLGRFGWKADVPSVAEFVRDAMGAELGLTLPPQDGLTFGIMTDVDGIADPELSRDDAEDLALFISMMAGPPRAAVTDPAEVAHGESLFAEVGCAKCHVPSLPSSLGEVPLYSDLLLHEILPPAQSGIVSGDAGMRDFRTAPLWGLRVTAPYFHSGEADTVEQAILLHDGEAAAIRQAYENLSEGDRAALLNFLSTL